MRPQGKVCDPELGPPDPRLEHSRTVRRKLLLFGSYLVCGGCVTMAPWTKEFLRVTDRGRLPACRPRAHSMVPPTSRSQRSRTCCPPGALLGKLTPRHGSSFLTCAWLLPLFPPPDTFSPSCLLMLEFGSPLNGRGAPKEQGFALLIPSTLFYPPGIRRGLAFYLWHFPSPWSQTEELHWGLDSNSHSV